jgi:hypothetical protein
MIFIVLLVDSAHLEQVKDPAFEKLSFQYLASISHTSQYAPIWPVAHV